jgi:hypothetical protein
MNPDHLSFASEPRGFFLVSDLKLLQTPHDNTYKCILTVFVQTNVFVHVDRL